MSRGNSPAGGVLFWPLGQELQPGQMMASSELSDAEEFKHMYPSFGENYFEAVLGHVALAEIPYHERHSIVHKIAVFVTMICRHKAGCAARAGRL